MTSSLLVALLLLSQPDPAQTAAPAVEDAAAVEADVAVEAEKPAEDDVICRRKFDAGSKFGQRNTSTKVCKTREEWEASRRKR